MPPNAHGVKPRRESGLRRDLRHDLVSARTSSRAHAGLVETTGPPSDRNDKQLFVAFVDHARRARESAG
jgi:hypothetical protein